MVPNQPRWPRRTARAAALVAALTMPTLTFAQVKTESGVVTSVASSVPGVQSYLGIPYGASTAGVNRWKAPQPPAKWEGIRAAGSFGQRCVQARAASGP